MAADRLSQLRSLMKAAGIDYYFIPSADDHQNEYVPSFLQRRAWISGFTGSAGDVLVGLDQAYLWTDGRYILQAEQQLDLSKFQIMKQQFQGFAPPIDEWLKINAQGKVLGIDAKTVSVKQAKQFSEALYASGGKLLALDHNLIDEIWSDRPQDDIKPIFSLDKAYTGLPVKDKIKLIRAAMNKAHVNSHVLTMLDAIAWTFNIRGQDIKFNPLVISYAIIDEQQVILFIDPAKVPADIAKNLNQDGVSLKPYVDFVHTLTELNGTVWLDPATASFWVQDKIKAHTYLAASPVTMMKALKNETEQNGAREAHRRDALAYVRFLNWLDQHWMEGQTEISVADKLEAFRKQDPHFKGLSFNTISGFSDHGAIIHYAVSEVSNKKIDDKALFLFDSGAQFLEGTTDITRVFHLGNPTQEEKHHYTLVLKGHLALRHAIFPLGTFGENIDALARAPIWKEGMNYGHGTGHGVGAFLCVHEGPQRISTGPSGVALQDGMIVSNEPGLYFAGKYGIRIENLCLIKECIPVSQSPTSHGPFLTLEDLTLVPYNKKLINKSELTVDEIKWINEYHQLIWDKLHQDLAEADLAWLKAATDPL